MDIAGAVAVVVGADRSFGAAVAHALRERGAATVHAVGAASAPHATMAACRHSGVTLLVNCLLAVERDADSLAGHDLLTTGYPSRPLARTLATIDAFAPVLAAQGGGAVVNLLCVQGHSAVAGPRLPTLARAIVDWSLSDGLRDRLAAQRTQLLYISAQVDLEMDEHALDHQNPLARHVAIRALDRLEALDRPMDRAARRERSKFQGRALVRRQGYNE